MNVAKFIPFTYFENLFYNVTLELGERFQILFFQKSVSVHALGFMDPSPSQIERKFYSFSWTEEQTLSKKKGFLARRNVGEQTTEIPIGNVLPEICWSCRED